MRSIKIAALVTLLALGGLLAGSRAEALPLSGAPAIGTAAEQGSLLQDVAYVCRRLWRCGPYGCGWRRACYWTPGPVAYAYPYGPYWGGYSWYWGRPSWRGGWRGTWRGRRHWR
jgi:hypothetical protein